MVWMTLKQALNARLDCLHLRLYGRPPRPRVLSGQCWSRGSARHALGGWQARLRWAVRACDAGRDARTLTQVGAGFFCCEARMLLLLLLLLLLLQVLQPLKQLRSVPCTKVFGGAAGRSCCREVHHGAIR